MVLGCCPLLCRSSMALPVFSLCCILCSLLKVEAAVPTDIRPNVVYSNPKHTTAGSVFMKDLNTVLAYFAEETPPNGTATYFYEDCPESVYGLSECYNMSQGGCGQCINSARDAVELNAPLAMGAQIWINNTEHRCYLHFENFNIFPAPPSPPGQSLPPSTASRCPSSAQGSSSKTGIIVGITLATLAACSGLGF